MNSFSKLNTERKIVVSFHHPCKDGAASSAYLMHCLKKRYSDIKIIFVGWRHGQHDVAINEIRILKPSVLYFLDCCPSPKQLDSLMSDELSQCVVLDHHLDTCKILGEHLIKSHNPKVTLRVSDTAPNGKKGLKPTQAGINVVSKYCYDEFPNIAPPLSNIFEAIAIADIWAFNGPEHMEHVRRLLVGMFLVCPIIEKKEDDEKLYPLTFDNLSPEEQVKYMYKHLEQDVSKEARDMGMMELVRQTEICKRVIDESKVIKSIAGENVIFVPHPHRIQDEMPEWLSQGPSLMVNIIKKLFPDYAYIVMLSLPFGEARTSNDGSSKKCGCSLRTINITVSEIAQKLGGNGHAYASGCCIELNLKSLAQCFDDLKYSSELVEKIKNLDQWDDKKISQTLNSKFIPFSVLAEVVAILMNEKLTDL